jgi:membrane-bound inhibitor of C-type lysozyme
MSIEFGSAASIGRALAVTALLVLAGGSEVSGAGSTVVYDCKDGTKMNAVYDTDAETVTLEIDYGVPIILKQAVSGSGIRYTGAGYELYGKGDWANVIRPSQRELECKEIGRINGTPTRPAAEPASGGQSDTINTEKPPETGG